MQHSGLASNSRASLCSPGFLECTRGQRCAFGALARTVERHAQRCLPGNNVRSTQKLSLKER